MVAEVGDGWRVESRGRDVVALEREVDPGHLVVGAADWSDNEERLVGLGQHHPFASTGADERTGRERADRDRNRHAVTPSLAGLPNTLGYIARQSTQLD